MKRIIALLALTFALCLPLPAMAAAPLPEGIIAIAPDTMNWSDAKAYCASRGGKLPLFGGKNRLAYPDGVPSGIPVDIFGSGGEKWPPGLPFRSYWLGTERNTRPGHSWIVFSANGNVHVSFASKNDSHRVACVAPHAQAKEAEMMPELKAAGNFVKQLQALVAEGKKQELARLVNYPLTVDGKKSAKNMDAFVKSYDAIFTKAVQTCLREHNLKGEIFSRNGQYMVGWGCIWFSPAERGGMTIDAVNTNDSGGAGRN